MPSRLLAAAAAGLACCVALWTAAPARGQQERQALTPPLDASLEGIRNPRYRFSRDRGRRVVVLFYEDRNHLETNDELKTSLNAWIASHGLQDRLVTFGVANLLRMPSHVPRFLVRSRIEPLCERWGADILLDWDGILRRAPWPMQGNTSNVAILDRQGRLVWHTTGPVRGERRRSFFATLRHYLRH